MKAKENIDKQLDLFLDDVLKTAPDCSLSSEFAKNIKSKVYQTFLWKQYLGEFFIAVSLSLLAIGVGFAILYFINDSLYFNTIIATLLAYKYILLAVLGFTILLFFYNYVLLNFMLFYYKKRLANK